jgi:3-oxoacyl-[acyl-carrier protein] reductase
MANELASFGITVNNILPGYTKTARLDSLIKNIATRRSLETAEVENEMLNEIPAMRFGDSSEVARVAAFLATPAASYVNGVNIQVDGGKIGAI